MLSIINAVYQAIKGDLQEAENGTRKWALVDGRSETVRERVNWGMTGRNVVN